MAIQIYDNSGEASGLGVNTDHEVLAALNQDAEKSGFVSVVAEKGVYPDGTRLMRELEVSEDYRLRVEFDSLLVADYPIGTAVNTKKWATVLTTQTITVGGARYELNSSGITTVNTGSMLRGYRFIPFYKATAAYAEFNLSWSVEPVANWYAEWGFGTPTTAIATQTDGVFFRVTAGQLRGVCVNAGTETYVDLGVLPAAADTHDLVIEATMGAVHFWHDGALLGTIAIPATLFGPTSLTSLPLFARTYNGAIAPSVSIKLQISAISASMGGSDFSRLWPEIQTGMGNTSLATPTGTAVGQTANYANTAAPASATLSNTAAGYTTLGGQFQFAAVAGAETDYALFGYQVPTGITLNVRGITIDTMNTGAAVATSATWLQWAVGIGSTAVALNTADAAATKAPARLTLGNQVFPIAAAIGVQALPIAVDFSTAPLVVNSGEFFHVILKMPLGTATASQIIRGVVGVIGFFE